MCLNSEIILDKQRSDIDCILNNAKEKIVFV